MKEKELREKSVCSKCGNKIMSTGVPLFWTVNIKRHGLNHDAIKRQSGLEMMLGSVQLAHAMGTNEDMTETIENVNLNLCENCAMPIMLLIQSCGV